METENKNNSPVVTPVDNDQPNGRGAAKNDRHKWVSSLEHILNSF